jgi:hypothetical protein
VRFDDFFYGLSVPERRRFADLSGYTYDYIRMRLATYSYRRGRPRQHGFWALADACAAFAADYGQDLVPTREQLEAFFYGSGGRDRRLPPGRRYHRGIGIAGTIDKN